MKTEKHIDDFIATQKQTGLNPFLTEKIMAKVASKETKIVPLWQTMAVAASIALAIVAGVSLGNVYDNSNTNYVYLEIDDTSIENLNHYRSIGYE